MEHVIERAPIERLDVRRDSRLGRVAPFVAVVALAVASISYQFWAIPVYSGRTPAEEFFQLVSVTGVIGASAAMARRRPMNPMWKLVLWFCACGLLQDFGRPSALLRTIEALTGSLTVPAFVHLVLAYPSGFLMLRMHRWLVWAGYALAFGTQLSDPSLFELVQWHLTVHHGPMPPLLLALHYDLEHGLSVMSVVGLVMLLGSLRRAPTLSKPLRAPLYLAATVSTALYLAIALKLLGFGDSVHDIWWYLALQTFVPVALAGGLLAERRGRGIVADLLIELERSPVDQLEPILGHALKDPRLTVRFLLGDDTRVDIHGEPVGADVPQGRAVLAVRGTAANIAEIVHDELLTDQPELLRSVAAAARFALENARMQAQLRGQVDELRSSRERIVEAAEAERRRIERNLHDGTQQRLIALGMNLDEMRRGLRSSAPPNSTELTGALDDALSSLRVTVAELRALSRGVHPPILTARGLLPAVRSLLDRMPVAITLSSNEPGRFDPSVEAAAYYVVSEALTNALRHAHAAHIAVDIRRTADSLIVIIEDDGVGGADPESDGLRLLADRVSAVGGVFALSDADVAGTRVEASLPCG